LSVCCFVRPVGKESFSFFFLLCCRVKI
jgi:hypothetical protein